MRDGGSHGAPGIGCEEEVGYIGARHARGGRGGSEGQRGMWVEQAEVPDSYYVVPLISSLPNLRHRPRLGSAVACNEILKEMILKYYTSIWLLAALGCAAGGTKLFTGVEGM